MITVEKLCQEIWRIEEEKGLLDRKLAGVKVWQLLRMVIYYKIAQATGVFTTPHAGKLGLRDILTYSGRIFDAAFRSPFRGNYTKDILIFDHWRKVIADGEHIDIYSKYLLDELDPDEYEVVESVYAGKHVSKKSKNRTYLDALAVGSFLYGVATLIDFNREERHYIRDVEQAIEQAFGVQIDLSPLFKKEIKHFRFSYNYYSKLIKKRKPKKIYLVVSYSFYKRPLIAAAKDLNVETIELQHGTLSPYHLGYSFPGRTKELDYFPDTFHSFGEYWHGACEFPIPKNKLVAHGFKHFANQKKQYENIPKIRDQILFISQGVIGGRLTKFALECAEKLPDCNFIYKLHPGEYGRWKTDYDSLVKANGLPNFEVVDNNNKSLYSYFAESEFQVGVFSTAIYEGLAFGCKTFVVDLPGIEYMRDLIEKKIVALVKTADEFANSKDASKLKQFESSYFFKS